MGDTSDHRKRWPNLARRIMDVVMSGAPLYYSPMSGPNDIPRGHIALEVDGVGISPETVDVPAFLEAAAAFFSLVQGNAKEEHRSIALVGIRIVDKCVAIVSGSDRPDLSKFYAERAHLQIEGKVPTPRGLTSIRERAQTAIRRMPSGVSVKLIADGWSASVVVHTPKVEPLDSLVSLRVTLIRLTGEPYPKIRLKSKIEKKRFSLNITKAQAQQLGPHILREIDIDARIRRDSNGYIADGKLLEFTPVDSENDATALWRAWYRENASEWDKVDDIESELKR